MARRFLLEGPGCVCKGGAANLVSMEWLTTYPSLLLWADSILVSQADYDYVCSGSFMRNDQALGTTYALFFERLKSEGIIATFDPKKTIPRVSVESIENFVALDLEQFGTNSKEDSDGKIDPCVIESSAGTFCGVALENIYTNLLASRLLGCSCLMDRYKADYVNERFKLQISSRASAPRAFDELYSVLVPELNPHETHRLFCKESTRTSCKHGEDCERQVSANVNHFIDEILLMRSKPEIIGLSSLIESIESQNPEMGPSEITRAVINDIAKAQNRLHCAYPHVKRWTRIVGEISIMAASFALASPVAELVTPILAASAIGGLATSAAIDAKIDSGQWKIAFIEDYWRHPQQFNGQNTHL